MTTTAQNIAAKFNVLESAIVRVEEWANVIFCVIKGLGSRFVSKKLKAEEKMIAPCKLNYDQMVAAFKAYGADYLYHAYTRSGGHPISSINSEAIISRGSVIARDAVVYCTVSKF